MLAKVYDEGTSEETTEARRFACSVGLGCVEGMLINPRVPPAATRGWYATLISNPSSECHHVIIGDVSQSKSNLWFIPTC